MELLAGSVGFSGRAWMVMGSVEAALAVSILEESGLVFPNRPSLEVHGQTGPWRPFGNYRKYHHSTVLLEVR